MRKEKLHIDEMIRIIMRHIDNNINEEENTLLQEWINDSEENKKLFEKTTNEDIRHKEIEKMASYNKADAWKKINSNKRKSINVNLFVRIAAAIVIILTTSILIFQTYNYEAEKIVQTETISAGRSTARLITASGESYNLDTISTVHLGNKSRIENDGKQLIINSASKATDNKEKKIEYNTIQVPRGGEYSMTLADGTKIHLNSESSVRFPDNFTGKTREIFLKGEAYFDVKKDKKPFIVHINDTYIKVLGTSFNINAYSENHTVQTTLVTGCVAMGNSKIKEEIKLKPGYQGEYNPITKNIAKKQVNIDYYIGWKNGIFAFKNKRFEDVMTILSRWYEFDVFYQNASVKDIEFTGKMKRYADIKDILKNFEMTEDLSFTIKGKSIIIRRNK